MSAPRRPGDIPDTMPLSLLAQCYERHSWTLACHRRGIGDPLPDDQRDEHILAALAYQAALDHRVPHGRWPDIAEALACGLSLETVAAAAGTRVEALRVGLRAWATGLDEQRREAVLALIVDEATS